MREKPSVKPIQLNEVIISSYKHIPYSYLTLPSQLGNLHDAVEPFTK